MEKLIERHFTYLDIQDFCLKVFTPVEHETVTVKGVKLLSLEGCTRPLWFVQLERRWRTYCALQFACVVTERTDADGKPCPAFVLDESLPFGLSSPAEEDAEIERARRQARELRIAAESAESCIEEVQA